MASFLHTMVRITDPERSRGFYEALGFRFSRDMDIVRNGELEATNYFFSIGDQENVLELTYNHDGRTYDLGTGYGHVAIGVDDLDGTLAALKDGHGIEPERPPYQVSEGGSRICFVRDPDDYRIELIERALGRRVGQSVPARQATPEGGKEPEVVGALDRSCDDERRAQRDLHDRRRAERAERPRHVARGVRVGGRGRPLLRVDDADDVRLARRDVHLAQSVAREQQRERGDLVGRERIEREEDVRGQVREDHRVDEPDAAGQPDRDLERSAWSRPTAKNTPRASRATSRTSR